MGFFSGSKTSTVTPVGKLIDSGVFSDKKENIKTKELSQQFLEILTQSGFLQDPSLLNDLSSKLAGGESFLGDRQRNVVLDNAQGEFNKRGLSKITENEALSALAPFEIEASTNAVNRLNSLSGARGIDLSSLMTLIQESRPDLLTGSTTTESSNPSGIAKISSLLSLGNDILDFGSNVGSKFMGIPSLGGGGGGGTGGASFGGRDASGNFFSSKLG